MSIKWLAEEDLCGDVIALYLDHGGDYTNTHVIKWHRTIHTHCSNVNFLVLILS